MSKMLFSSGGAAITLGGELARGGEGCVLEVSGRASQVAKLYHKDPSPEKRSKLSFMASSASSQLLKYVAWPQETLHEFPGGTVVGYLMPKVVGKSPVHTIYSPAHRRQTLPNAGWDFLIWVARNVAAAVETVHSHGHVIGDVNQDSFLVGRDSTVVMIDSDSFQINVRGNTHYCDVGVAHFTPPELQSIPTFSGVTRSGNHDNFGLALLVFHILFGGRHPYSGVPTRSGVGDALETDIKNFSYAYARDHHRRGNKPPPKSVPVEILPESMEAMFSDAFTEAGATRKRPTAQEWVTALDDLRNRLVRCASSKMHVYARHMGKCPWCALEQQGVWYFVDLGSVIVPQASGFMLAQVWGLIQAVPPPATVNVQYPANLPVKAQPLPPGIPSESITNVYRLLAVVVAIMICIVVPAAFLGGLVVGFIGWVMAENAGVAPRASERAKRRKALDLAQQEYNRLTELVKTEAGPTAFNLRKAEYIRLKNELENLARSAQQEIDQLQHTALDRQKHKYLESCFIDSANIPGIGNARKVTLRSFGIETAADVTRGQVMQIRGFGESLARAMMDWRASCERRFRFNSANAVTQADRNAVYARQAARKLALERALTNAPTELQQLRQKTVERYNALKPQIESAALRLAQARADSSLL